MDDAQKTRTQLGAERVALRDVTAEHEAAETMRSSDARYRALAENASDLITEFDEKGNYLFISPNVYSIIGYTREQLMDGVLDDGSNIEPEVSEALRERFIRLPQGDPGPSLYRIRHGDGSWCWLESTGTPRQTEDGGIRTVVIGRNVTERVHADQELLASEERYRRLADVSREWITEADAEGCILYASPNCKELLGLAPEEIVGTTPYLLIHPDDVDRRVDEDLECTRTQQPFSTGPYRIRHKNGSWRWVESRGCTYPGRDGEPVVLRVTRDITPHVEAARERRDLEARMHQTQKLEGLGVMAGGIAHDFNNLLTPILGDTSLALLDLPADSPVRVRLQRVQAAAHRAAALTNQMLSYAGEESLHVEALNLSALVEEMGQLLETAASRQAVLVYQLQRDLPLVEGDPARLSQVVMNLITNAAEALDEDEGRIVIRTGKVELGASDREKHVLGSELPPGEYVFFEVIDTGSGMDADTRARIFDPFFTTKFTGRGLGLAAVLGIVRAHRGAIGLQSQPNRGTTFRVLLPSTDRRFTRPPDESTHVESWRGEGTVLIIDDEEGVREMSADTLTRAGFTVICGNDGREGIELFERHADEIRAVLLDRTMPNTSGEEVFDEIRQIRPNARIILTSGYSQKRAEQRFIGKGLDSFLHKPFLPVVLLQTLKKVLETSSDE